ncbi:MAG: pilus assembly protein PilP [Acinetobacter sp.]
MNKCCYILMTMSVMLWGCDSRMDDVQQEMAKIRNESPLAIAAAPTFDAAPTFLYSAQHLRNPFLPNSLYTELKVMAGKQVYPDLSRKPQPLEAYALETLKMKGTMHKAAASLVALIQTPDGNIQPVYVGNYMGLNRGRITRITPSSIELAEILSDGQGGYVERPRNLVLLETIPSEFLGKQ